MRRSLLVGLVGVIVALGVGGIAFATSGWTAQATINGSATAGTFSLTWEYTTGTGSTDPVVGPQATGTCSDAGSTSTAWTVAGSTFSQGDGCSFANALVNSGNLAGTISWSTITWTSSSPSTCPLSDWTYSITSPLPSTIGAGGTTATITIVMQLDTTAPVGCMGQSLTLSTLTATGTAS